MTYRQDEYAPVQELRLSPTHLDLLMEHVRSGFPLEVCGFLGGVGGDVVEVIPIPNIAPQPSGSFFMNPQDQWKAMRTLFESGMEMVAIYHSHPPGGCAEPSQVDIASAYYPETLYLIVVPGESGEIVSFRAFAIDARQVSEVSIVFRP